MSSYVVSGFSRTVDDGGRPSGRPRVGRSKRPAPTGFCSQALKADTTYIRVIAILAVAATTLAAAPASDTLRTEFVAASAGEAVATVRAGCARCDWGEPGREAAALRVSLDGKYSQHILLVRGEAAADYRITLGAVGPGRHRLTIDRDPALSARGAGPATIDVPDVAILGGSDAVIAQSRAPILYARPNTVGRFTDLPLLMWYEVLPTPHGRQFRYSVIFSNEDGGTETDRLMATWGRTTDIEYVYGVEVNEAGRVLAEEFQGPGHEVPVFKGRHEAAHPLLWVSTDNNMVSESGPTRVRYAPAPERADLEQLSREAVMDRHPWTYAVASVEMRREGKIGDEAPPGHNMIPDPRRFVYVEACGMVGNAALAFAAGVRHVGVSETPRGSGRQADRDLDWIPSDRGLPKYRIVRDGCFRAAIPLPAGAFARDVRALRVAAYERPPADGQPALSTNPVQLTRINKVFTLDDQFAPGPTLAQWLGPATIRAGGTPFEIPIP